MTFVKRTFTGALRRAALTRAPPRTHNQSLSFAKTPTHAESITCAPPNLAKRVLCTPKRTRTATPNLASVQLVLCTSTPWKAGKSVSYRQYGVFGTLWRRSWWGKSEKCEGNEQKRTFAGCRVQGPLFARQSSWCAKHAHGAPVCSTAEPRTARKWRIL